MTERRVVLFGGSGFVGRHLAPRLAAEGWTVRVASHRPQLEAASTTADVVTVTADLGVEDQVRRTVAGAEAVINLVGIAREREASFEAVHVEGAARVARLAAAAGVPRLLHFSALGIAEDAPSAADRTKARGEMAVRAMFPAATFVRPSLIYGPGDHFFSRFTAMTTTSPVLPLIGGGRTRFQPLHIDEAIRTLLALLERPETAGQTFALAGAEIFTFRELLERLLALLGRRRLLLSLPFPAAEALAAGFEQLPQPPLTREEVRLLRTDKVAGELPTPAALGLATRRLEEGLPASLGKAR
jgi:NADH dehydrogenase